MLSIFAPRLAPVGQPANLMKYAPTIQNLSKHASVSVTHFYDKAFRQWWENSRDLLRWEQLNAELFNQALGMGLTQTIWAPSTTGKRPPTPTNCCFRFNRYVKLLSIMNMHTGAKRGGAPQSENLSEI